VWKDWPELALSSQTQPLEASIVVARQVAADYGIVTSRRSISRRTNPRELTSGRGEARLRDVDRRGVVAGTRQGDALGAEVGVGAAKLGLAAALQLGADVDAFLR
jgi:hypothetical protein